ncbi:hypothetical protein HQ576_01765 [bacterium]|nr:hypothetical protein [bacterium]
MDQHVADSVHDFRRRIDEQRRDVSRLQATVVELETQGMSAADDRRALTSLRRARADLKRASGEAKELDRIYARFLLREGLGNDPDTLDDDVFDEELQAFCNSPASRRWTRGMHDGPIGFDTCRQMLLADLPVAELAENERAMRKSTGVARVLDGASDTHAILRQWASLALSDAHVAQATTEATAVAGQHNSLQEEFHQGLDSLRVDYEIKQHGADGLSFHTDGQRTVLRAENDWGNVADAFPERARTLGVLFHELQKASRELKFAREALNQELRSFLCGFVTLYLTLLGRQSKERRRQMGLSGQGLRRLMGYLLDEIENVDFLLVGGGGLEVPQLRIPAEVAAFARTAVCREHQEAVAADEPDVV